MNDNARRRRAMRGPRSRDHGHEPPPKARQGRPGDRCGPIGQGPDPPKTGRRQGGADASAAAALKVLPFTDPELCEGSAPGELCDCALVREEILKSAFAALRRVPSHVVASWIVVFRKADGMRSALDVVELGPPPDSA